MGVNSPREVRIESFRVHRIASLRAFNQQQKKINFFIFLDPMLYSEHRAYSKNSNLLS